MKKPELKDFGLTQESLDLYQRQRDIYDRRVKESFEDSKATKKVIVILSLLVTIIAFIVNASTSFETSALTFLGICMLWDFTIGLYCLDSLSDYDIGYKKRIEIENQTVNEKLKEAVYNYKEAMYKYEKYLEQCSISFWTSLNGFEFENEIAKLYRKQGYDAQVTSKTGDGGVDIIITKGTQRIAVQCKHHAKPVGPNDVRALQGVVASQNYSSGIFISLNGYTTTVHQEVLNGKVKIELLDLRDILQIAKGNNEKNSTPIENTGKSSYSLERSPKVDDVVIHKNFGRGIIKEVHSNYLLVEFSNGIKKMAIPFSFSSGFLKFHNDTNKS